MIRKTHFALELMKTGISFLNNAKARSNLGAETPFRSVLCYCIKQVKPGFWLPLNRDYNVLGLCKGDCSNYGSILYDHMLIKSEEINFDVLWDNDIGKGYSNNFFTFADGSHPSIYYQKTYESQKTLIRYIEVIHTAFFGESSIDFEKAWKYKKSNGEKKYYDENLLRFK